MKPKISDLAENYVPPHIVMTWAGREVTVYKMSLLSAEKAVAVAEPYIKDVIAEMVGTATFTQARSGQAVDLQAAQEELNRLIKEKLSDIAVAAPSIVFQILAHIMDIPEEGPIHDFYWSEVPLEDLLGSIEQLDELNNFANIGNLIVQIVRSLASRYGLRIPDATLVKKAEEG